MVNINELTDSELDSLGYSLHEQREKLSADLQNISGNIVTVRGEKMKREQVKAEEEKKKVEDAKKEAEKSEDPKIEEPAK